jgi:hypothetical protein
MKNCKICKKEISDHRTYCGNVCKFSDVDYNKSRSKRPQNDPTKIMICKGCGWKTKDIKNLSGAVTEHLLSHSINYNGEDFNSLFDIKDDMREKLSCCLCDWWTYDLNNKSGAFTNHITKKHNITVGEFIEIHGEKYKNLWLTTKSCIERIHHIESKEENRVVCGICNMSLKILSNSHLKLHNMTPLEYKNKYGVLISDSTKILFSENLSKIEMPPQSKSEQEIFEFISSVYSGNIITNTKQIIPPFEVDIYVPDLKFAIEVNGLYFHSELSGGRDKHYHLAKTIKADSVGIKLLHIFEDEWKNKKDIIKSMLLHKMNVGENYLNARSMKISIPTSSEKDEFLKINHLQGSDKSNFYIGLYDRSELVSLMTFGSLRTVLGNKSVSNQYELMRFCNKIGISCRGSFSKLLSHFIKNKNPDKIITYADCRFSFKSSNVYKKNGFEYVSTSKPNYFYMKNHEIRLHRFNFPKHKLVKLGHDKSMTEWEIMKSMNYDRIWDCGHLKYEWNKKV